MTASIINYKYEVDLQIYMLNGSKAKYFEIFLRNPHENLYAARGRELNLIILNNVLAFLF